MKKGFFAFSSTPEHISENVNEAIKKINTSSNVKIVPWRDITTNGNYLIKEILNVISDSDFFCADLTGMNDNVLFELGFALGKRKPVFLILDTSHTDSVRRFKEFNLLTTVGYSSYHNTQQILDEFHKSKPFESKRILIDEFSNPSSSKEKALFYIKGQIDTNNSQEILNSIENQRLPYILDDPVESKTQPLSWYIDQIKSVPAILTEFSSIHRVGHELHNTKCALITGLALGLNLKVLMVAEKPYPTQIDYQEFLRKYTNRQSCREAVAPFIYKLKDEIAEIIFKKRTPLSSKERTVLQKINFGEYIAEHENENLYEYFVETAQYESLIKSEHNIVIGRKGTGKTATFYYLNDELGHDSRNHICLVKPINFEIDGLVYLYKELSNDFEKGYVTESIWKFLIYTEISKSIFLKIKDKPIYAISQPEDDFIKYIEANKQIFLLDFSTRLEQELDNLRQANKTQTQAEFKIKISEILHDSVLLEVRNHIKKLLTKNKRLIVLIDNLDKSWRTGGDISILSKFLLGLLGVVGRISVDFKGKPQEKVEFTFHLILFLRSDIFKYVMINAREPDKIEFSRLRWNDPQILFRVIETRFSKLSAMTENKDLWQNYITHTVEGKPIKNWVSLKVLPRPRDIIYLFTVAKDFAISRGHMKIEESDIISAQKDYSNWAFKSVIVENGITTSQMENFMYQLMGEPNILNKSQLEEYMKRAEINAEGSDMFIDHLVSLSILGREISENHFEYEYEFDGDKKIKVLAEKFNTQRFRLHDAFTPYLESTVET
ncbi:MAG: hypothetical protein KF846_06300 [Cyclobacteriaceae bacterium]|nr:hypothetical protein [Cyclobacteriaceae bacterium]